MRSVETQDRRATDGTTVVDQSGARKNDGGKLRYDLIPVYPIERLAEVYSIGAVKYDDRNWERGMVWGRVFRAMLSHAWKWWRGETYDPVDGQHHLASVAWCAFALMEYEHRRVGTDDRVPYPSDSPRRPATFASLRLAGTSEYDDELSA